MPQLDPSITISIPVKSDSSQPVTYKNVTVVITDTEIQKESDWGFIIGPLLFVLILASLLLLILFKTIKPGKKTDRILDTLENITEGIDDGVARGRWL